MSIHPRIYSALHDAGLIPEEDKPGHYMLGERTLGMGSFGTVLLAYQELENGLWRRVALKQIQLPDPSIYSSHTVSVITTASREVHLCTKARGHHVVHIYTPWFSPRRRAICIPLEYMDMSLEHYAKHVRHFVYPPGQLQSIFTACLEALVETHAHNVVHRDIKPENFLVRLCPQGRDSCTPEVKLSDFGLSTLANEFKDQICNMGTPFYMAPECHTAYGAVEPFARDVWSLGCVFHFLLTGSLAFPGATCKEVYHNTIKGKASIAAKDLEHIKLTREISALIQVTLDMLRLNPAERPFAAEALETMKGMLPGTPTDLPDGILCIHHHCSPLDAAATSSHYHHSRATQQQRQDRHRVPQYQRMSVCRPHTNVRVYSRPEETPEALIAHVLHYTDTIMVECEILGLPCATSATATCFSSSSFPCGTTHMPISSSNFSSTIDSQLGTRTAEALPASFLQARQFSSPPPPWDPPQGNRKGTTMPARSTPSPSPARPSEPSGTPINSSLLHCRQESEMMGTPGRHEGTAAATAATGISTEDSRHGSSRDPMAVLHRRDMSECGSLLSRAPSTMPPSAPYSWLKIVFPVSGYCLRYVEGHHVLHPYVSGASPATCAPLPTPAVPVMAPPTSTHAPMRDLQRSPDDLMGHLPPPLPPPLELRKPQSFFSRFLPNPERK